MKRKIVFLPYDFDTAIGITNEGVLAFSYNLEDIDQTESGADIFNGQQSVLWKNLRATYFDELRTMFQSLRSSGALSYEKVERMFEEHQAKWPEAVFNEDAWFKYLAPLVEKGNASYLSMLQGSKAEQRKWWLYNRFRYMDSKYNAGDSLSDVITVRGYAKADITVIPYADVYVSVKYGSYLVQKRAARNLPTTLECPLDNVNDTEVYCYSASQLADVGDLSGLMVGYADFSKAVRLQRLKLGDASDDYSNGNLKELYLGNNELLRTIDVRNCPALTQAVVISGCSNIEHVFFDGTSITGLELPDGGILKTLHLPSTMTALSILNQPSLTEFVFPAGAALTTLRIENTPVDTLATVRAMPANSRVRLIGFNWALPNFDAVMDLYDHLDTMRGINENNDNVDTAQLYGTIHVPTMTTDLLREARSRYNDISITADEWTYRVRFMDGDTVLCSSLVPSGTTIVEPISVGTIETPTKESVGHTGYVFDGWDGELSNITEDRDIQVRWKETHAYEVTFKNWNDEILIVKLVPEGTNCADPIKTGEIETPTRPGDSSYVYTFLGWTGAGLNNVKSDRTVTASFSQVQSYTIQFQNWDYSVLLTLYLQYGAQIPDPLLANLISTPVRPDDTTYEYAFRTWSGLNKDGSFPTVTGNKTFVATYSQTVYYRFTFVDYDNTVLLTEKHYARETVTDPVKSGRLQEPTREADETYQYFFWKWNYEFPRTAGGHLTIKAMYRTDAVHTVKFVNWDSTVLDTQLVADGFSAEDPIASGRISTPLRSSTAAYDYTFYKWNTTFTDITADKTITAQYTSTTRKYNVTFMDETTELGQSLTTYGTAAMIPSWPEKPGDDAGKYFVKSWNPSITNIVAETTTYAVWLPLLQDSWAEIFAAEQDGTYKDKYSVGQVKMLELGDEKIPMRIVGFDKDELAEGSGYAKISWMAMSPLSAVRNAGFTKASTQAQGVSYAFAKKTSSELGEYWESTNTSSNTNSNSVFTITAAEDTDMTIWAYCSSEDYWDTLCVWIGDELVVNCIGKSVGETAEVVCHLTAGEAVKITAQYHKDSGKDLGEDKARLRFLCDSELTVTSVRGAFKAFGGIDNGWLDYTLHPWMVENILPALPAEVQSQIVTVKKYSGTDGDGGYVISEDKVWPPSRRELMFEATKDDTFIESVGCQYDDIFSAKDNDGRIIAMRGTPVDGFLRTCKKADGSTYYLATSGYSGTDTVNREHHVFFGFCT